MVLEQGKWKVIFQCKHQERRVNKRSPCKVGRYENWMRENLIKFRDFFDNRLDEFLSGPVTGDEE